MRFTFVELHMQLSRERCNCRWPSLNCEETSVVGAVKLLQHFAQLLWHLLLLSGLLLTSHHLLRCVLKSSSHLDGPHLFYGQVCQIFTLFQRINTMSFGGALEPTLSPLDGGARQRKVLIINSGSRGDIQPYVALASHLKSRNFHVLVITNSDHVSFLQSFGLEALGLFVDVRSLLEGSPELRHSMATGSFGSFMEGLGKLSAARADEEVKTVLEESQRFAPDLVVGMVMWGKMISTLLEIPYCGACLQICAPSRHLKSFLNEPCCHYTCTVLVLYSFYNSFAVYLPKFLAAQRPLLGDKVLWPTFESFMLDIQHPTAPSLVAVSPHLSALPPDWTATNQHITGCWVVGQETQHQHLVQRDDYFGGSSERALQEFLQGGPPVYMGWGSMTAVSPEHMTCLAVRCLKRLGMRGVILAGWAQLKADHVTGQEDEAELKAYIRTNVLFVDSAPHEWLFPRCSVTVHHGGAGTTVTALRSGNPTVVTPCWYDQFGYAEYVRQSGCGIGMKQFQRVTVEELSDAIQKCQEEPIRTRCAEVARCLQRENGVAEATNIIETFLSREVATGTWRAKYKARERAHKALASQGCFSCFAFAFRLLLARNPFPAPRDQASL